MMSVASSWFLFNVSWSDHAALLYQAQVSAVRGLIHGWLLGWVVFSLTLSLQSSLIGWSLTQASAEYLNHLSQFEDKFSRIWSSLSELINVNLKIISYSVLNIFIFLFICLLQHCLFSPYFVEKPWKGRRLVN